MQPILNALEGSKYNTMLLDCMLATLIGKLLNLASPITDDEASSIEGVIICSVSEPTNNQKSQVFVSPLIPHQVRYILIDGSTSEIYKVLKEGN